MRRLVALDMDGTLTQHRTPLDEDNTAALHRLAEHFPLVVVGAGSCQRIHRQLNHHPIHIIGSYGMEMARWDEPSGGLVMTETTRVPPLDEASRAEILTTAGEIRARHGYTEFAGESVEFHASGMLTFALLGTDARIEDKLAFDPDRSRRRAFYREVCEAFREYTVFVGGSSSFDIVPRPFDKLHALRRYCGPQGIALSDVAFIGDDFGPGGNDEQVYHSEVEFWPIEDYREFPDLVARMIRTHTA